MMLIMSVACLFKTLKRYIRVSESLCSVKYVQSDVFQIPEEDLCDMVGCIGYRLFLDWFQVISVVFWLDSDSF